MNEDTDRSRWGFDRRTALKASAGLFGGYALTGTAAGKGRKRGQSCECPEGEFLAKYEFQCVETECTDFDAEAQECLEEECVDWGFVLSEGEDLVDIPYEFDDDEFNKDGEDAEPNYIEFEADGYVIQGVCAYGGGDTDDAEDADGLESFSSALENNGGREAAISNVTFCGTEAEVDFACPFYGTSRDDPTAIFSIQADSSGTIEENEVGQIPDESANSNYPNGVAFDKDNDIWYFTEETGELKTMNEDGSFGIKDSYGVIHPDGEQPIAGAAFWDTEGEYLYIPNGTNRLMAADISSEPASTRDVTSLAWSGIGLGDLAIDRPNQMLYVSTTRTNESGPNFFSVDLTDLSDQREIVASSDRTAWAVRSQIAFDDAGTLWAHNANGGDWRTADLSDGSLSAVVATTQEYTDLARCGFYEEPGE